MILFLILGVVLGAVAVVFVLQNTAMVTVTFMTWHLDGSLAIILFLAIMAGAFITLLLLLPSFVKDLFALSSLKRQKKALEEELAARPVAMPPVVTTQVEPNTVV